MRKEGYHSREWNQARRQVSLRTLDHGHITTDGKDFPTFGDAIEHQIQLNRRNKDMTTGTVQSIIVNAMSPEHAKRVAAGLAHFPQEAVKNVQQMKAPRPAKTCKTDDFPQKGTRKWKVEYQIYSYGQKVPIGRGEYHYTEMEFQKDGFEMKTDAVKAARELSIVMQMPMTVKIVHVLDNGNNTVSDLEPKTALGEFRVEYMV